MSYKQRNQQQVSPKAFLKLANRFSIVGLASGLVLLSITLLVVVKQDNYKDFHFEPTEDSFFENPANWQPAYPGTHIQAGDRIILHGPAYATFYDIKLEGAMEIYAEGSFYSFNGNLEILPGAEIQNHGELMVNELTNAGIIDNQSSATVDVMHYTGDEGSVMNNLLGANFTSAGNMVNKGIFNNYGLCAVRDEFKNLATFNELPGSELVVHGNRAYLPSQHDLQPAFSQQE